MKLRAEVLISHNNLGWKKQQEPSAIIATNYNGDIERDGWVRNPLKREYIWGRGESTIRGRSVGLRLATSVRAWVVEKSYERSYWS